MNKKEMTIADIEALKIRYSWQGYKDGEKVAKAQGWYPVKFGYGHAWGWMVDHIRKMLANGEIDTAIIKKTRGDICVRLTP